MVDAVVVGVAVIELALLKLSIKKSEIVLGGTSLASS